MFKKAEKKNLKLRMALCGPAGAGKTYSALSVATALGGKIAMVDTEHGSASKYADLFSFDVVEPSIFDPRDLIETIRFAEKNGYSHLIIDSLSHYWSGKGGELDMVDNAAARSKSGNTFAAWKTVTPVHNELIDTIISCKVNIFATMRTKTEWVIEQVNGKNTPRKIGLAPVMRDGIEFEFDVVGDIDQDNNFIVTKSRCPELSGKVINRPGRQMAEALQKWLSSAPIVEAPEAPAEVRISTTMTEKTPPEKTLAEKCGFNGGQAPAPEFSPDAPGVQGPSTPEVPAAKTPETPETSQAQPTSKQKTAGEIAAEIKQIKTLAHKQHGCKTLEECLDLVGKILGNKVTDIISLGDADRQQVLSVLAVADSHEAERKAA